MKDIIGYEGLYEINESGEVFSKITTASRRKGKLKPYVNVGGYLRVNLYNLSGSPTKKYIHRLVAEAYLENPGNLPAVNHISADKQDNSIENLEWCDAKYNIAESRRLKLQKDKRVVAISEISYEIKKYDSIKDAAIDLAGKRHAFQYLRKKYGDSFNYNEWKIEVMPT